MLPEKKVENEIKQWITNNGYWLIKIQGGCNNPDAGVPDILACINGFFVGIEVKRPEGGRVSKLQIYQIKQIRKAGGIAFVCKSLEEFRMELHNANIVPYDAVSDATRGTERSK